MKLTTFRKPDDERRFDEIYARLRAERWPSPPSETDVGTRLGTAHVFSWPGDGVPLLLLPGWGATSLMWAPMLVHGFGGRPVHCVDVIGDVGLSVQRAPIATLSDHLPWLDAVAVGLDLDRVFVCGLAEGLFPTRVHDDSLLPDADRRATGGALPLRAARVDDAHRRLRAAPPRASGERVCPVPPAARRRTPARWTRRRIRTPGCRRSAGCTGERSSTATRRGTVLLCIRPRSIS